VIESTGISEPMPVAATFSWEFDDGFSLARVARLDTLVTVVDTSTFLSEIAKGEALADRDMTAGEGDARSVADLLVDQVEFADVILLNKTDLVPPARLGAVETVVRRLNPTAKILHTQRGVVDIGEVLDTGLFDPVAAAEAPGWDEEIADGHTPETEEYGIASMTFRADRPFHPQRLFDALDEVRGVLRSKGFCWIASRPEIAAIWSQAGPNLVIEPAQFWSATELQPGQEIVLIGVRLDRDRIQALLVSALLTDDEVALGAQGWATMPDPLPAWGVTHSHAH
jgi:G3E family GTPase